MRYSKIDNCNMNNGDGLRCVLWVSGCHHQCPGCFNKETWDFNMGDLFTDKEYKFICEALSQDWCSGLTITGGDPLSNENFDDVYRLVSYIRRQYPQKTIWIYTGYKYEEIPKILLNEIDVLCDGQFVENLKSPNKHWVGSANQKVINIEKSLSSGTIIEKQ